MSYFLFEYLSFIDLSIALLCVRQKHPLTWIHFSIFTLNLISFLLCIHIIWRRFTYKNFLCCLLWHAVTVYPFFFVLMDIIIYFFKFFVYVTASTSILQLVLEFITFFMKFHYFVYFYSSEIQILSRVLSDSYAPDSDYQKRLRLYAITKKKNVQFLTNIHFHQSEAEFQSVKTNLQHSFQHLYYQFEQKLIELINSYLYQEPNLYITSCELVSMDKNHLFSLHLTQNNDLCLIYYNLSILKVDTILEYLKEKKVPIVTFQDWSCNEIHALVQYYQFWKKSWIKNILFIEI